MSQSFWVRRWKSATEFLTVSSKTATSFLTASSWKSEFRLLKVDFLTNWIFLLRYVPPISGEGASAQVEALDTEKMIDEEIKKQESLLADLHLQISSGAASKKTEEQIWEQQRIVTQLKV